MELISQKSFHFESLPFHEFTKAVRQEEQPVKGVGMAEPYSARSWL